MEDRIPNGTRVRAQGINGETFTAIVATYDVAPDGTVLYEVIADEGQGAYSEAKKHAIYRNELEVLEAV